MVRLYDPTMAGAQIKVHRRPQAWPDHMSSYTVVLDGEKLGKVKRGESIVLLTDPGQHILHLKNGWLRSPMLELELRDGQSVVVECWPNGSALLWPYWVTFGYWRCIGVRLLPDATT